MGEIELHKKESESRSLSEGIKILAYARALRWVGWGLGEALIPIFILKFSNSFVQMGLFSSMVELSALICLPIIGMLADKTSAKKLILLSLVLYPLVGASYFLAGILATGAFIVLARIINGLTWELENVGIETYYRRVAHHSNIATSFGYLDTWSNAAWIVAALVGMLLVTIIPIHYLFLGISPFAVIAYFIVRKAPLDKVSERHTPKQWLNAYASVISQWKNWNAKLKLLAILVLFSSLISALTDFFLPIGAYLDGANLPMVVLLAIFGAIPSLFGYRLGRVADAKHKGTLLALGLLVVAILIAGVAIFDSYAVKLIAIFLMGTILELFSVIKASLVTTLGAAETYGLRGSAFESIVTIGDLTAPVALGIAIDRAGFSHALVMVSGAATLLGIIYYLRYSNRNRNTVNLVSSN